MLHHLSCCFLRAPRAPPAKHAVRAEDGDRSEEPVPRCQLDDLRVCLHSRVSQPVRNGAPGARADQAGHRRAQHRCQPSHLQGASGLFSAAGCKNPGMHLLLPQTSGRTCLVLAAQRPCFNAFEARWIREYSTDYHMNTDANQISGAVR